MNKKGFTLVEVTISVALLSLVMVFMLRFISEIRRDEDTISLNTDLLLNKTILSKSLNKDVSDSLGFSSTTCSSKLCTFNFNNGKKKTLEVSHEGSVITYKNITDDRVELSRKLPDGYVFSLEKKDNSLVTIIEINVSSIPEYNIEIVDDKVNR